MVPLSQPHGVPLAELLLPVEIANGAVVDRDCTAGVLAQAQQPAHGTASLALRVLIRLLDLGRVADRAMPALHALGARAHGLGAGEGNAMAS